nr:uncharacterized protein LOC104653082 [Saimiri boliviensis boliviensis]
MGSIAQTELGFVNTPPHPRLFVFWVELVWGQCHKPACSRGGGARSHPKLLPGARWGCQGEGASGLWSKSQTYRLLRGRGRSGDRQPWGPSRADSRKVVAEFASRVVLLASQRRAQVFGAKGLELPSSQEPGVALPPGSIRPSNTHLIRGRRKAQDRREPSSEARPEGITHTENVFLSEKNGAQNNSESEWAGPQSESPAPRGRCRAGRPSTAAGPFRWSVGQGRSPPRIQAARCAPATQRAAPKLQPAWRTRKYKKGAERFKQSEAEASRGGQSGNQSRQILKPPLAPSPTFAFLWC